MDPSCRDDRTAPLSDTVPWTPLLSHDVTGLAGRGGRSLGWPPRRPCVPRPLGTARPALGRPAPLSCWRIASGAPGWHGCNTPEPQPARLALLCFAVLCCAVLCFGIALQHQPPQLSTAEKQTRQDRAHSSHLIKRAPHTNLHRLISCTTTPHRRVHLVFPLSPPTATGLGFFVVPGAGPAAVFLSHLWEQQSRGCRYGQTARGPSQMPACFCCMRGWRWKSPAMGPGLLVVPQAGTTEEQSDSCNRSAKTNDSRQTCPRRARATAPGADGPPHRNRAGWRRHPPAGPSSF